MLSLNVCGLKSKLLDEAFCEECKKHDILCFTETKLDDCDQNFVEEKLGELGFMISMKNTL